MKQPVFPDPYDAINKLVTQREQFLAEMDAAVPSSRPLALSDPMAEETLYDGEAMRRFARTEFGDDRISDGNTTLNFRHLLEQHGLTEVLSADMNTNLVDKGNHPAIGTLVDTKIIDAPFSTKTGSDWYFGMKAQTGKDANRGVSAAHCLKKRPGHHSSAAECVDHIFLKSKT